MDGIKKYGLVGRKLGHSFSKKYFEAKFENEKIKDCLFDLYELQTIAEINALVRNEELKGFSVTIPYKVDIINYCHDLDPEVKEIGAVNCVKVNKGKLRGYNTDHIGFIEGLDGEFEFRFKHALVCGTGGASLAVKYALQKAGFSITEVSTSSKENTISYGQIDEELMNKIDLIVNCTPLGTFPNNDEFINVPYELLGPGHYCYDLVYNPEMTKFLEKSAAKGAQIINGIKMLEAQAEAAWKIWNS